MVIGSECYWVKWKKQLEPNEWTTQYLSRSWTACPWALKVKKSQLEVMDSMSATSGAHVMSSCRHKKGKQWLPTPLLVLEECSLLPRAFPCQFQHNQLTMALHFTGNYGFWYYSCGRPMDKSLTTVGHIQDTWGMGKLHDPCPSQSRKGLRE